MMKPDLNCLEQSEHALIAGVVDDTRMISDHLDISITLSISLSPQRYILNYSGGGR